MPSWNAQHHIAFTSHLGRLPAGGPSGQTFIVDGIIYNYVQGILTMSILYSLLIYPTNALHLEHLIVYV
jgi:hypothetical protein